MARMASRALARPSSSVSPSVTTSGKGRDEHGKSSAFLGFQDDRKAEVFRHWFAPSLAPSAPDRPDKASDEICICTGRVNGESRSRKTVAPERKRRSNGIK